MFFFSSPLVPFPTLCASPEIPDVWDCLVPLWLAAKEQQGGENPGALLGCSLGWVRCKQRLPGFPAAAMVAGLSVAVVSCWVVAGPANTEWEIHAGAVKQLAVLRYERESAVCFSIRFYSPASISLNRGKKKRDVFLLRILLSLINWSSRSCSGAYLGNKEVQTFFPKEEQMKLY